MSGRVDDLCRRLRPILGTKIDNLWQVWVSSDTQGRSEIEQTLELLAAKHLGTSFEPDRSPFPPPPETMARAGDIPVGQISYAERQLYPFRLPADRLTNHALITGRSGSGKTQLTFNIMQGVMERGLKVLALDWKRAYRNLKHVRSDVTVYTVGRDVAPIRFNPLIPPSGCEPGLWIKRIIDVIASAYLGGEGVISLLTSGLDHLYREFGLYDGTTERYPTVQDLLDWLNTTKLTGRAAMWKASTERILAALSYGEFANVVSAQDNTDVRRLLDQNCVLELDGLASNSDRTFLSEALMLYLYQYRLSEGPKASLTNLIVLEEAHHLLHAKDSGARESVLESSIRLIREYGIGYLIVDQSASTLSKVAFANTYAIFAMNQKLASDVRTVAGAMNLGDQQKEALNTLPVGRAVVRLSDQHPEPFLVDVPKSPVPEGAIDDGQLRQQTRPPETAPEAPPEKSPEKSPETPKRPGSQERAEQSSGHWLFQGDDSDSKAIPRPDKLSEVITAISRSEKNRQDRADPPHPTHPKSSGTDQNPPGRPDETDGKDKAESDDAADATEPANEQPTPTPQLTREAIRFLADVAERPLSTTVRRYERLHFSRRRGNAIRDQLAKAGFIEPVRLATRSGQVVLTDLTDAGRDLCKQIGIDAGPPRRESLEHVYWVDKARQWFADEDYKVMLEYAVDGNGRVDLLAETSNERIAVEVETGQSNIAENLTKLAGKDFDRILMIATSPAALDACRRALRQTEADGLPPIELLSWLDLT